MPRTKWSASPGCCSAGPDEAAPHRVSRRLGLLPTEDLGGAGSRQLVEAQRGGVLGSFDPRVPHANARARADAEDRVGAARDPRHPGLDEGLEVATASEGEGDVARRPFEA